MFKWTKKKIILLCIILGFGIIILPPVGIFLSFSPLCLKKVKDQSELYGRYEADYPYAKEELILNQDNTFIQTVTLKASSKIDMAKGVWKLDPEDGYLIFDSNFLLVLDGAGKPVPEYAEVKKVGKICYPAIKWFGKLLIEFQEGIYYKKVEI